MGSFLRGSAVIGVVSGRRLLMAPYGPFIPYYANAWENLQGSAFFARHFARVVLMLERGSVRVQRQVSRSLDVYASSSGGADNASRKRIIIFQPAGIVQHQLHLCCSQFQPGGTIDRFTERVPIAALS